MYDPVKDGVPKSITAVVYTEVRPPAPLSDLVHCFWELRTERELESDFSLHAIPDACTNLLFNQLDPRIAGVTRLHTTHTTLDLGRTFHYAGIQLFPGVWRGDPDATVDHYVGEPYAGDLPLVEVGRAAAELDFDDKVIVFAELVERLIADDLLTSNPLTATILTNIEKIRTVADMATVAGLSSRQLQRSLQATTGFAPHDLLKVLRVQQSFRRDVLLQFADQAHFTHQFKSVTGLTPGRFRNAFDV